MPRPHKMRRVTQLPPHDYYKPAGVPLHELEEVTLRIEELEAVRLKDLEGLDHEGSAQQMQVSRATFHRILASAHLKIAQALTQGLAIRIEGGHYHMPPHHRRGHLGPSPSDDDSKSLQTGTPPGTGTRGRRHRGGKNG